MNPELAILRIVHILGGIIWVGTSVFMGSFLMPALATVGPTGGAVIGALKNRRLFTIIPAIALLTMLAGLRLMMIVVAGNWSAFFATRGGATYLFGAICALAGFLIFMSISHPSLMRAIAIGPQMAQLPEAERGPLAAELGRLRARGGKAGAITALLLVATAIAMSLGRYM